MNLDGLPHVLERLPSCAVVGAFAMAARGYVRQTIDFDLLTTDARALDEGTWAPLRARRISVVVRRGELDDPIAGVATIELPAIDVDVLIGWERWQQDIIDRAEPMPIFGMDLRIPTLPDLLLLKLWAGGYGDLQDVAKLIELGEPDEISAHLGGALPHLPEEVTRRWNRLLAELGG